MAALLNGVFSVFMEGYLLSTGGHDVRTWSMTKCAGLCLANMSCMAFFYNKKSGLCQLSNSQSLTDEELAEDSGMRFYVLYRDSCPTQTGYRLSRDPSLCYRISKDERNHGDAMTDCQNDGGFLIRIDSQEKQDYFNQLFTDMQTSQHFWIDGSDIDVENEWRFSDGTLMMYAEWGSSQPNNDGNCVRLRSDRNTQWYDQRCDGKYLYICEIQHT